MLENNQSGFEVAFGEKSYKYHYLDSLENIPADVPRFELLLPTLTRNMGKTVADVRKHLPKVALTPTQESMLDQGFSILVTDGTTHGLITPYGSDVVNDPESCLMFQLGGLDMVNQNGRMYPTAVLEKALNDFNNDLRASRGKFSEVRLHDGNVVGNVKLDAEIKHDKCFAMRAHQAHGSDKLKIVSWDLIQDEMHVPFTAVKQTGDAVRAFAEKIGSRLSAFLETHLIYINQCGEATGYVSKADYNEKVGRGASTPEMSIDLGAGTVSCHEGKAFLNGVHVLRNFKKVIGVTYGADNEPLWLVEPVPVEDNGNYGDSISFIPPEAGNYGEPAKAYFALFASDAKKEAAFVHEIENNWQGGSDVKEKNASVSGAAPDFQWHERYKDSDQPKPLSDLSKSLIDPNLQLKDSNMEPLNEQNNRAKETHFVIENDDGSVALHEGKAPRGLTNAVHVMDQSPFTAPWDLVASTPEGTRLWSREENRLLSVEETEEVTEDLELGALADERLKDGVRVPMQITDEGIVPKEPECAGDESYALKADLSVPRERDESTMDVATHLTPSDFTNEQLNVYIGADPSRLIHCNDGHVVELPTGELVRVAATVNTIIGTDGETTTNVSYRFLTQTEELNLGNNRTHLERSIAQVEAGETVDGVMTETGFVPVDTDPADKIGRNSLSGSMPSHADKVAILGTGAQSAIAALAATGRGKTVSGAGMSASVTPKVDRKAEAKEHNEALAQMPPTTYPIVKVRIDGFNVRCEILELTWRQMENDHKLGKYIVARPNQQWAARRISGISARSAVSGETSSDILGGPLAGLVMKQMDETTAFEIRYNRLSSTTPRKFTLEIPREVWVAAGYNTTALSVLDV